MADAPGLAVAKALVTPEDNAVSLVLTVPTITDTGTGTVKNDYSERISAITLTLGGPAASGATFVTVATTLTPVGGQVAIVLIDAGDYLVTGLPAANPANGIYHLTIAEYQAVRATPPAESGRNFTVTVGATSSEIDATGTVIATVPGVSNTQIITVDVQAATDGATLASSAPIQS